MVVIWTLGVRDLGSGFASSGLGLQALWDLEGFFLCWDGFNLLWGTGYVAV